MHRFDEAGEITPISKKKSSRAVHSYIYYV
jgi:hypothetical protein